MASLPALASECPPFPQVEWWEGLDHDTTKRFVAARHQGDWSAYIAKWHRQLAIIENIYARGKAGIIQSTGLRLEGEALRQYILQIEERIAVIECLAREEGESGQTPHAQRPRAGEIPEDKPQQIVVDVPEDGESVSVRRLSDEAREPMELPKAGIDVEITSQCVGGNTIFRVVNRGDMWPEPASFIVMRSSDLMLLTQRRIRMAPGQSVAFRVESDEPMELRIVPPWKPEDFRVSQAQCR